MAATAVQPEGSPLKSGSTKVVREEVRQRKEITTDLEQDIG